ncbi:hypothetical protein K1719_017846 [Acacia pycnantha]|nr:hypothetical protein K1719_017846 [Acacia pycnantha]
MENLAMKELERGHDCVNQLQRLMTLKSHNGGDDEALTMSYAQDLCAKVDDSLRNAIFLLNYQDSPANADEFYQTSKSRSHTIKDPTRFSPQKRKSIQTWEDYSEIGPKEDGYAWRKYGQKFILNAKHPRCYFRCTCKHDNGCEATKHVQIIQDSPPLYRTTYFGYHTCSKPHMFLDSHDLISSSTMHLISFDESHNDKTTLEQKQ